MKKLLFLILPVLPLASCQQYGDKITQTYTAQQCPMRPLDAATLDSAQKGYVVIDSSHVGNPSICAVLYKIEPSFAQKWELSKKNGARTWCFIFLAAAIALIGFGIKYSSGGGKPIIPLGAFVLAIILLCCSAGVIDWAHTKEAEIPKSAYDSLKATPDGLKPFWDENLYK